MAGAWELQQNKTVLCAILHVDQVSIGWAMGFRNLIIPGEVVGISGMPFDQKMFATVRGIQ